MDSIDISATLNSRSKEHISIRSIQNSSRKSRTDAETEVNSFNQTVLYNYLYMTIEDREIFMYFN